MEEVSGGRMHYMFNRVGGLKEEVPAGWTTRARQAIGAVRRRRTGQTHPADNDIFMARTVGVGVLSAATAAAYGASGPVPRATGLDSVYAGTSPTSSTDRSTCPSVDADVRRLSPRFEICWNRSWSPSNWPTSVWTGLTRSGPGTCACPRSSKPPESHTYAWTENPLGINGYYLVSRGEKTPWRLKLRTASYANVRP